MREKVDKFVCYLVRFSDDLIDIFGFKGGS